MDRIFHAPDGYKRLTINLREDIHKKIKLIAVQEELQYLEELAIELIATCEQGDPKAAWVKLEEQNLDGEQKIALWTLLPSKVRTSLKKAKEL